MENLRCFTSISSLLVTNHNPIAARRFEPVLRVASQVFNGSPCSRGLPAIDWPLPFSSTASFPSQKWHQFCLPTYTCSGTFFSIAMLNFDQTEIVMDRSDWELYITADGWFRDRTFYHPSFTFLANGLLSAWSYFILSCVNYCSDLFFCTTNIYDLPHGCQFFP